jgi:hypothetical protein
VAGLLSGLVGISVLVASFFQWFHMDYNGRPHVRRGFVPVLVVLIGVQAAAIGFLFA